MSCDCIFTITAPLSTGKRENQGRNPVFHHLSSPDTFPMDWTLAVGLLKCFSKQECIHSELACRVIVISFTSCYVYHSLIFFILVKNNINKIIIILLMYYTVTNRTCVDLALWGAEQKGFYVQVVTTASVV